MDKYFRRYVFGNILGANTREDRMFLANETMNLAKRFLI